MTGDMMLLDLPAWGVRHPILSEEFEAGEPIALEPPDKAQGYTLSALLPIPYGYSSRTQSLSESISTRPWPCCSNHQ